jgi:flagellar motor switch protein FliN/FliY
MSELENFDIRYKVAESDPAPQASQPEAFAPEPPSASSVPASVSHQTPGSPCYSAGSPPPAPTAGPANTISGDQNAPPRPADFDMDLLLDIPVEVSIELGRSKIPIRKFLKLNPGDAIKLVKLKVEPVNILVSDTLIARGQIVIQKEKYGIRVTEITSRLDRIKSFY